MEYKNPALNWWYNELSSEQRNEIRNSKHKQYLKILDIQELYCESHPPSNDEKTMKFIN